MSVLSLHVAGLAETDKIGPLVGLLCRVKKSERPLVVNRQGAALERAAFGAPPALVFNHSQSYLSPRPPSVGLRPTDPARGSAAAKHTRGGEALPGAEARPAILAGQPRLLKKLFVAVFTPTPFTVSPRRVIFAGYSGLEGVCWPHSTPELVAKQVGFGADIKRFSRSISAAAFKGTKACFVFSVGLYRIGAAALFAGHFNHVDSVSERTMSGNGTSDIACKRIREAYSQPDLFIEAERPKPKQTSLLDGDAAA